MHLCLVTKLESHTDGGMQTWLQHLWDHPPKFDSLHKIWVTTSKSWLRSADKDSKKYSRVDLEDPDCPAIRFDWTDNH